MDSNLGAVSPKHVSAGQFYERVSFDSWNAEGNDVSRADFIGCRIRNVRSPGLIADSATFEECEFVDCDLTNASILGVRFVGCTFIGCKLLGWKWVNANSHMVITLKGCQCAESSFYGLQLKKLKFTDCTFTNADFAQAKLGLADLSGSDFTGARFHETDLSGADFRTARNYEIDVRANIVKKARFALPEAVRLLDGLGLVIE